MAVSKTVMGSRPSGVRIPLSPPFISTRSFLQHTKKEGIDIGIAVVITPEIIAARAARGRTAITKASTAGSGMSF